MPGFRATHHRAAQLFVGGWPREAAVRVRADDAGRGGRGLPSGSPAAEFLSSGGERRGGIYARRTTFACGRPRSRAACAANGAWTRGLAGDVCAKR